MVWKKETCQCKHFCPLRFGRSIEPKETTHTLSSERVYVARDIAASKSWSVMGIHVGELDAEIVVGRYKFMTKFQWDCKTYLKYCLR